MEEKWEKVFASSMKAPHDDKVRGSFYLAFFPDKVDLAWKVISRLTEQDRLGYMSSLSPDVMFGDQWKWKGAFTIAVHAIYDKRHLRKVKEALEAANFGNNIFKSFCLIKRFRTHPGDDGARDFMSENEMSTDDEMSEDDDNDEISTDEMSEDDGSDEEEEDVHSDKGIKRKRDYDMATDTDSDYETE